jgi:hypothetical protein
MDARRLSGIINALEQVTRCLVAIEELPSEQRRYYWTMLDSAYSRLDSRLLQMIHQLDNLLDSRGVLTPEAFVGILRRLIGSGIWYQSETVGYLGNGLHTALEAIWEKVGLSNPRQLHELISEVTECEGDLADVTRSFLSDLAHIADKVESSATSFAEAKEMVRQRREELMAQCDALLAAQHMLHQPGSVPNEVITDSGKLIRLVQMQSPQLKRKPKQRRPLTPSPPEDSRLVLGGRRTS